MPIECVHNIYAGCPRLIRSDYGTENCILAASQMALRHGHPDPFSGVRSFQYGKSTGNTVSYSVLYCVHVMGNGTAFWLIFFRELRAGGPY